MSGDVEWFTKTGHCGKCGQSGNYCLCTDREPCDCQALHPMGSGKDPAALDGFAVVDVSADQGDLFGGAA